jgi:hypothetical protein
MDLGVVTLLLCCVDVARQLGVLMIDVSIHVGPEPVTHLSGGRVLREGACELNPVWLGDGRAVIAPLDEVECSAVVYHVGLSGNG